MIFTQYPGHTVTVLIAIVLSVFLFWAHRGSEIKRHRLISIVLFLLNGLIVVLLIGIMFDPSSSRESETQQQNEVLIYVDTSQSMSLADAEGQTRLDDAIAQIDTLYGDDAAVRPKLRLKGFDSTPYESTNSADLIRWGSRSNLSAAMEDAARYINNQGDRAYGVVNARR